MTHTGSFLYNAWDAGRKQGLSQRALARLFNMPFNALHGKIWRYQEKLKKIERQTKEKTLKNRTVTPVRFDAAVFDIETNSLWSAAGINNHAVCCCIKPLGKDEGLITKAILFEEQRDDARLVAQIRYELEKYDIVIGHNISGYDLPWLNTRLGWHGLAGLKPLYYYDTYQAARRVGIKHRKSLANLIDFLELPQEKTAIYPVEWSYVDSPVEEEFDEALAYIVEHCGKDVFMNELLFYALWEMERNKRPLPVYYK